MSGIVESRSRDDLANVRASGGDGLAGFLRRRHPSKTAEAVAAETGLPAGSVRKWIYGETTPSLSALAVLAESYGAECLAAAFLGHVPAWLDEAVRVQRRAEYLRQIAETKAKLDRL